MVHVLDFEQFRDKRRSLFISFRLSDLDEFQKLLSWTQPLPIKRHQNDAKNTCIHDATTVTTWERPSHWHAPCRKGPTGSGQAVIGVHHSTVVRLEQRYNTTAAQDRANRLSHITGLKCQGHMWDSNTYIWFHKIRAKTLKK